MTFRGSLRTLLAVRAMPIAPSAAAKLSWPARKAKHLVSSCSRRAPRLPWPRPTLRCSATEPGMQNACRPIPMAAAASEAVVTPFFSATATPRVYAQLALSKAMGCTPFTIPSTSMPLDRQRSLASSRLERPYSARHFSILASLLSLPSNFTSFAMVLSSFSYSSLGSMYFAALAKRP